MRRVEIRGSAEDIQHAERKLWLAWVIATTIAAGAGWALALAIMRMIFPPLTAGEIGISFSWDKDPALVAVYGFIGATVIACGQRLVLGRHLPHSLWWLILTPAGGAIGSYAGWYALVFTMTSISGILWIEEMIMGAKFGLVGGLIVGIVQYAGMARAGHRNHRWIWATGLGGALGMGFGFPMFYQTLIGNMPEWMNILLAGGGGLIAGAVGGAVTGLALIAIVRNARARTAREATSLGAAAPARVH